MATKTTHKRRRTVGKALTAPAPAAPQDMPALFKVVAASVTDVEGFRQFVALKREIEAHEDRRAFDQDFAALQAELSPVEANAYDAQKRRSYADLNALVEAVGPLAASKGFGLTYDAGPGSVDGTVKVTVKLMRNGVERTTSVDIPMDGAGMRGNANVSAPQACGSSITYGRKLALSLMFNLTVSGGSGSSSGAPQHAAEPQRQRDDPPPWDASEDRVAVLKRASEHADRPPSDKQISYLASLMGKRGEPASAVLGEDGVLDFRRAGQAISERTGDRQ